jgi:hypothetical protein
MITTRLMPRIIIGSTGNKKRFFTNRVIAGLQRLVQIWSAIAEENIQFCYTGQRKARVPLSTLGKHSADLIGWLGCDL